VTQTSPMAVVAALVPPPYPLLYGSIGRMTCRLGPNREQCLYQFQYHAAHRLVPLPDRTGMNMSVGLAASGGLHRGGYSQQARPNPELRMILNSDLTRSRSVLVANVRQRRMVGVGVGVGVMVLSATYSLRQGKSDLERLSLQCNASLSHPRYPSQRLSTARPGLLWASTTPGEHGPTWMGPGTERHGREASLPAVPRERSVPLARRQTRWG